MKKMTSFVMIVILCVSVLVQPISAVTVGEEVTFIAGVEQPIVSGGSQDGNHTSQGTSPDQQIYNTHDSISSLSRDIIDGMNITSTPRYAQHADSIVMYWKDGVSSSSLEEIVRQGHNYVVSPNGAHQTSQWEEVIVGDVNGDGIVDTVIPGGTTSGNNGGSEDGTPGGSSMGTPGGSTTGTPGESSGGAPGTNDQGVPGGSTTGSSGESSGGASGTDDDGLPGGSIDGGSGGGSGSSGESTGGSSGSGNNGTSDGNTGGTPGNGNGGTPGGNSSGAAGSESDGTPGGNSGGMPGSGNGGTAGGNSSGLPGSGSNGTPGGTSGGTPGGSYVDEDISREMDTMIQEIIPNDGYQVTVVNRVEEIEWVEYETTDNITEIVSFVETFDDAGGYYVPMNVPGDKYIYDFATFQTRYEKLEEYIDEFYQTEDDVDVVYVVVYSLQSRAECELKISTPLNWSGTDMTHFWEIECVAAPDDGYTRSPFSTFAMEELKQTFYYEGQYRVMATQVVENKYCDAFTWSKCEYLIVEETGQVIWKNEKNGGTIDTSDDAAPMQEQGLRYVKYYNVVSTEIVYVTKHDAIYDVSNNVMVGGSVAPSAWGGQYQTIRIE